MQEQTEIESREMHLWRVEGEKFVGFILTSSGIEANPEKSKSIINMRSPDNVKEVQRLMGMLTILSRFLLKLIEMTRPIVKLKKNFKNFE